MSFDLDHSDLLEQIGFNSLVARAHAAIAEPPGVLVRVIDQSRSGVIIHTGAQSLPARALPALMRSAPLVVGDWALATPDAHRDWWVMSRLAPYSEFNRVEPSGARQALVTNIDVAFLVMGLDGDFNLRRLERYLALVKSAGVLPVIVLSKADLSLDLESKMDSLVERLPSNIERYAVNATDSATVEGLASYVSRGQTAVLLGSSGAGKSTLANTLTHSNAQVTGAVRESDSHGRHTTTGRQLLKVPGGGCLIDTPGLRGLRLDIDRSSLDASFEDIAALAARCQFRDCTHHDEPGCAVRDSVSTDRLANYHKLCREVARDRADPLMRQQAKAQIKAQHRAMRALQKERGR